MKRARFTEKRVVGVRRGRRPPIEPVRRPRVAGGVEAFVANPLGGQADFEPRESDSPNLDYQALRRQEARSAKSGSRQRGAVRPSIPISSGIPSPRIAAPLQQRYLRRQRSLGA